MLSILKPIKYYQGSFTDGNDSGGNIVGSPAEGTQIGWFVGGVSGWAKDVQVLRLPYNLDISPE